jgi:hypothetical protein
VRVIPGQLRGAAAGYASIRRLGHALATALLLAACAGADAAKPVKLDESGVPVLPEEGGTKRITPQQVAYLREKGIPFLLIDSRARDVHVSERPAGSVNVPLEMTEIAAPRLPGDRLLITLCT